MWNEKFLNTGHSWLCSNVLHSAWHPAFLVTPMEYQESPSNHLHDFPVHPLGAVLPSFRTTILDSKGQWWAQALSLPLQNMSWEHLGIHQITIKIQLCRITSCAYWGKAMCCVSMRHAVQGSGKSFPGKGQWSHNWKDEQAFVFLPWHLTVGEIWHKDFSMIALSPQPSTVSQIDRWYGRVFWKGAASMAQQQNCLIETIFPDIFSI